MILKKAGLEMTEGLKVNLGFASSASRNGGDRSLRTKKRKRIFCSSGPPAFVLYSDFHSYSPGYSKRGRRPPLCRFRKKDSKGKGESKPLFLLRALLVPLLPRGRKGTSFRRRPRGDVVNPVSSGKIGFCVGDNGGGGSRRKQSC